MKTPSFQRHLGSAFCKKYGSFAWSQIWNLCFPSSFSSFTLGHTATGACMAVCGIGVNGVDMNKYMCMQCCCS